MAIRKQSAGRAEARKRSYLRGEERKKARAARQREAEKLNKERGYTAWEEAKAKRSKAREGKQRAQINDVGHVARVTVDGVEIVCDHRNHKESNEQYKPATGAENLTVASKKTTKRKGK